MKTNPDLTVNAVAMEFRKFMKIIVRLSEDVCIVAEQRLNAFVILKQSQLYTLTQENKFHHVLRKELPEPFKEVYVRNINCYDPIEKLYYSTGYGPVAMHLLC